MTTPEPVNPSPKPEGPPTDGGWWLRPIYTGTLHYYPRYEMGHLTICGQLTGPATTRLLPRVFPEGVPACPACTDRLSILKAVSGRWLALLPPGGKEAHYMRGNGPTTCGLLWDPLYTTRRVEGLPLCPTCEASQ